MGFSFSRGTFHAVQKGGPLTTNNRVDEFPCRSINFMLDQVDENFFIVFDELEASTEAFDYFNSPNTFAQWGALFDPSTPFSFSYPSTMTSEFDVLFHFSSTNHAKPY